MKILLRKDYQELLDFLPQVKSSLKEWLFVDVRLTDKPSQDFPLTRIAELITALFRQQEGRLYLCNDRELLVLIRWSAGHAPTEIATSIEEHLPEGTCKVQAHELTVEGLMNLALRIVPKKPPPGKPAPIPPFVGTRKLRKENVILAAGSAGTECMRIVDSISGLQAIVHEVADGGEVLEAYKKTAPDLLLFDLDTSQKNGMQILGEILSIDPAAFVVVTSAHISQKAMGEIVQKGAKGFLAKPLTKERLQGYIRKCPTISSGTYRG